MRMLLLLCAVGMVFLLSGCMTEVGIGPTIGHTRILGNDAIPLDANPYDFWYVENGCYYHYVEGQAVIRIYERPTNVYIFDGRPYFPREHYNRWNREHLYSHDHPRYRGDHHLAPPGPRPYVAPLPRQSLPHPVAPSRPHALPQQHAVPQQHRTLQQPQGQHHPSRHQ